ncbi:MAG: ATP-binding cassette domain-containing protein, partial [Actinomycetota bacterium]
EWYDVVIDTVGLRDRLDHRPSELSGGQQQRVACARALVSRPHVIFADEPTGNLDSMSGQDVLSFLRRSVDEFGQTIVMVTHDPVAAGHSDRVVFLADGRIVDELLKPSADLVYERMKDLDHRSASKGH